MLFKKETKTYDLNVSEIHCGGCVKRIENVLKSLKEVKEYQVSLDGKVSVSLNDDKVLDKVISSINNLGFNVEKGA